MKISSSILSFVHLKSCLADEEDRRMEVRGGKWGRMKRMSGKEGDVRDVSPKRPLKTSQGDKPTL